MRIMLLWAACRQDAQRCLCGFFFLICTTWMVFTCLFQFCLFSSYFFNLHHYSGCLSANCWVWEIGSKRLLSNIITRWHFTAGAHKEKGKLNRNVSFQKLVLRLVKIIHRPGWEQFHVETLMTSLRRMKHTVLKGSRSWPVCDQWVVFLLLSFII